MIKKAGMLILKSQVQNKILMIKLKKQRHKKYFVNIVDHVEHEQIGDKLFLRFHRHKDAHEAFGILNIN